MVRALGIVVFAGMLLGASSANAQSLGEAAAAPPLTIAFPETTGGVASAPDPLSNTAG
jgi:hypothetical protein